MSNYFHTITKANIPMIDIILQDQNMNNLKTLQTTFSWLTYSKKKQFFCQFHSSLGITDGTESRHRNCIHY